MADCTNFIITPALEARYWAKVDKRGPDECWPWQAFKDGDGYGRFDGGRATHAALKIDGRPRPDGAHALHSCDNPPCQNPRHLRWGTNAENVSDMVARGRNMHAARPETLARGSRHGSAKLKDADVAEIRSPQRRYTNQTSLALEFKVSAATINDILTRRTWKHVP